ncbi:hypothetical protein MALG_03356 [Marinovum algicola DG 898]|nr:hypothetical protein MALG_03356 [Marinovum algicola DG 898]
MVHDDTPGFGQRVAQLMERDVGSWVSSSSKKSVNGSSLPPPFGRPCGPGSAWPLVRTDLAHLVPGEAESLSRNAAARPLNPSSIYF